MKNLKITQKTKQVIAISLTCLLVNAQAEVMVDQEYQCTSTIRQSATNTSTGERLMPQKFQGDTLLTFFDDGIFTSINPAMPEAPVFGGWNQRGNHLRFVPDRELFARNMEYGCAVGGTPCRILTVAARSIAKSNRDGTMIKGQARTKVAMLVNGTVFNVKQIGKFTCHQ